MDLYNYHLDSRVCARNRTRQITVIDLKSQVGTVSISGEDHRIPIVFQVCPICRGSGVHVNPSIDSQGLTREDFDRDPDFMDDYMSGNYDVSCYGCRGDRVLPSPDWDRMDLSLRDALRAQIEEDAAYDSQCAMDQAMGY